MYPVFEILFRSLFIRGRERTCTGVREKKVLITKEDRRVVNDTEWNFFVARLSESPSLSLLNVSVSNYTRHDCSINPAPRTRLNFTIDDPRALISRCPRGIDILCDVVLGKPRGFFPSSSSSPHSPHGTVIPNLDSSLITPVVSMTDWVTDGRREVLYTYGVRANADARRGDLSRLW